jgi:ketosteroid isomerase-like protein
VILGAAAPSAAFAEDDTAGLIQRQSQEFSDASATGDAAAFRRLLDDRVTFINESGETATKKDLVDGAGPPPKGIVNHLVQTDFHVQLFGNVAVTSFTDVQTELAYGQTLHAKYRSTEVWLKEGSDWRMISSQTLALADDPPAAALSDKELDDYVGTYSGGPGFTFTIARHGHELTGTQGANPPVAIKAELRDVLFTPGQPRARRIFQRDAQGKVVGFVSRREGHDLVLKKVG